jgi:hypothetical protein
MSRIRAGAGGLYGFRCISRASPAAPAILGPDHSHRRGLDEPGVLRADRTAPGAPGSERIRMLRMSEPAAGPA